MIAKAKEKEVNFYELELTIRAGHIITIASVLGEATGSVLIGLSEGKKLGSGAADNYNFSWHLTDNGE